MGGIIMSFDQVLNSLAGNFKTEEAFKDYLECISALNHEIIREQFKLGEKYRVSLEGYVRIIKKLEEYNGNYAKLFNLACRLTESFDKSEPREIVYPLMFQFYNMFFDDMKAAYK